MDSCIENLDPTRPHPTVPSLTQMSYDVSLTRLDIGVSVGSIENGQLHQLHFLQVVLPLGLHTHTHANTAETIGFFSTGLEPIEQMKELLRGEVSKKQQHDIVLQKCLPKKNDCFRCY